MNNSLNPSPLDHVMASLFVAQIFKSVKEIPWCYQSKQTSLTGFCKKFNKEGVGVGTIILQPLSLTSSIEQTVPWGRVLIQRTNLDQGSCRSQSAGKFGTKAQISVRGDMGSKSARTPVSDVWAFKKGYIHQNVRLSKQVPSSPTLWSALQCRPPHTLISCLSFQQD